MNEKRSRRGILSVVTGRRLAAVPRRSPGRASRLVGTLAMALGLPLLVGVALTASPGVADAAVCTANAGGTGLSAALVATASQHITANVDATGCDVGIFVGSAATNVNIDTITVSGANDHGILAVDTTGLTIQNSTVTGNGVAPTSGIAENKGIELAGTSNSTITGNTVTGNLADGGIGIADDAASPGIDPGAPNPGTNSPATNDVVTNNTVSGNYGGCGIVVASYNPSGVSNITVGGASAGTANTLTGSPGQFGPHGPVIGGIVVAADAPGGNVANVTVQGNSVTGSGIPGVVVHSNAPAAGPLAADLVTGVKVLGNTISGNDWLATDGPPQPAGIIVAATAVPPPAGPKLTATVVSGNTVTNEFYGVWVAGAPDTNATTAQNTITVTPGGQAVFFVPDAGTGYWMTAKDGGVFNYGTAGFYNSLPGLGVHLNNIAGMVPTADQGGYWMVGSDGGVFALGDAPFVGSMGGKALNTPMVAMAGTPYAPAVPPEQPVTQGKGYWLVGADGGVFAFGDAKSHNSLPGLGIQVNNIVGITPTSTGLGYWLVGSDGGVFAFGDAKSYNSLPGLGIHVKNIVGMVPTSTGKGYWLVGSDGGVFAFGDAAQHFYGSMGGKKLNAPVVGMAAMPGDSGYWLFATDGGVFSFSASSPSPFFGSLGGTKLNQPVSGGGAVGVTTAA
ncbi:MAG TPA: right-handed parallel beta-helix repeat-containing protein [Acidimicrobiales bacterium]|nr:right-handed parallel beta-helix repeat-containing protein [Acidimicrobiales bacterium]